MQGSDLNEQLTQYTLISFSNCSSSNFTFSLLTLFIKVQAVGCELSIDKPNYSLLKLSPLFPFA